MSIWSRLLGYLRKEAVTKRAGGVTKRPAGTGRAAMFEGLEGRAMLSATMPPADPSSLVAADSSSTAIKLTWHDNSVRETGYKIERSTDDKTFSQINSVKRQHDELHVRRIDHRQKVLLPGPRLQQRWK